MNRRKFLVITGTGSLLTGIPILKLIADAPVKPAYEGITQEMVKNHIDSLIEQIAYDFNHDPEARRYIEAVTNHMSGNHGKKYPIEYLTESL